MAIHYNTHRFGVDEDAVGRLINGDLPTDDQERWNMIEAPGYRIRKLFNEHLNAQTTLRDCSVSGRPFILFLRSFSAEHTGTRNEGFFSGMVTTYSLKLQEWLKQVVADEAIPIIKLHGGSDGFLSNIGGEGKVLSTHSFNWKNVASELIQTASVIVFLVSHMTAGVVEEFELIRQFNRKDRCTIIILNPEKTFAPEIEDSNLMHGPIADFPNVFELDVQESINVYPKNLELKLIELLNGAQTNGSLEQTFQAEFTYLEPHFTESEDFKTTETFIWRQLRLLRVMFDDTYWAALKKNNIAFQHFTFPGPWQVAHQVYGLSIVTADFRAVREALSYLYLLSIFLGKDLAFAINPLSARFGELASQIFPNGEPDREAQFAAGPDPLKLSPRMNVALDLFQYAEEFGQRQDFENAGYLYQAAIIGALKAEDRNEEDRNWIIGNMCRDWAKSQASNQPEWAVTNCSLAVKLFRDLVAINPTQYNSDLALTLNNLGSLQFRIRDFSSAEGTFVEALQIRRSLSVDGENYMSNLATSLANLGLLHVEIGKLESAYALYIEAITLCEERLKNEPEAIIDLTRVQGWMILCLRKIPERKAESLDYAQHVAENLSQLSQFSPETADSLRQLVQEVYKENN